MGMVLTRVDDPRDNLGKATRDELWDFAKSSGIMPDMLKYLSDHEWDVQSGWRPRTNTATQATITKPDMENFLRNRGMTNISVAVRAMGRPTGQFLGPKPKPIVHQVEVKPQEAAPTDISGMGIQQLRQECKRRGIKLSRTDNLAAIRDKLQAA